MSVCAGVLLHWPFDSRLVLRSGPAAANSCLRPPCAACSQCRWVGVNPRAAPTCGVMWVAAATTCLRYVLHALGAGKPHSNWVGIDPNRSPLSPLFPLPSPSPSIATIIAPRPSLTPKSPLAFVCLIALLRSGYRPRSLFFHTSIGFVPLPPLLTINS